MDPFLGEIKAVGFNYAPQGWALCNGALLNVNSNAALFSLLGATYGGNGTTTFALPNLNGRVAIGMGQSTGTSTYNPGQTGGSENVTLSLPQIPQHVHALQTSDQAANAPASSGNYLPSNGGKGGGANIYANSVSALQQMNQSSIGPAGGSQGHPNLQPYLVITYIIALQGIYPSRP